MLALTLIQPMGHAIVEGWKPIENRPRDLPPALRGVETVVAVHDGIRWSDDYATTIHKITGVSTLPHNASAIIGVMRLTGRVFTLGAKKREDCIPVIHDDEDGAPRVNPWFSGVYGYEIAGAFRLPEPVPARGMLGFWMVLPADELLVRAQLPAEWQ